MEKPSGNHGLSPEQQQRATELYSAVNERTAALQGIKNAITARWDAETESRGGISQVATTREIVQDLWRSRQANSSQRIAERHYRRNATAYQEQALHEATQAGHTINGWDENN